MKKLFALFISILVIFLSGCVQKDLVDIYVFSERFSKHCQDFTIDTENLVAKEENDILKFLFTFSDKFLLTINVNEETFLITAFSLTYMYDEKNKITDKNFTSFINIAGCAVKSFTNLQSTDEIFDGLSLKNKSDRLKFNHKSFKQGFYTYTFVSDEIGLYFTASTERR